MATHVQWDTETKLAVCLTVEPPWTWDEIEAAVQRIRELRKQVDHPVYPVVDIRKITLLPPDLQTNLTRLVANAQSVLTVFVTGRDSIIKAVFYSFSALQEGLNFEYRFASSLDEARQIVTAWNERTNS